MKQNRIMNLYNSVTHNYVKDLLLDGLFYADEKECEQQNEARRLTFFDVVNRLCVLLQKHYHYRKKGQLLC